MAVAAVLANREVAVGLGLGLFGVLSIIRLRSSEISQREVAYYFAALAIGLVSGLPQTDPGPSPALIALILAVALAGGSPPLLSRSRHQIVRARSRDRRRVELRDDLERRLEGEVSGDQCRSSTWSTTPPWWTCATHSDRRSARRPTPQPGGARRRPLTEAGGR